MSDAAGLAPSAEPRRLSPRKWIVGFAIYFGLGLLLFFHAQRTPGLYRVEVLTGLLLYLSVAFTFFPLPTAWIILWAARETDPLSVTILGTVGTCIANLHDYYLINYLFGLDRVGKVKETKLYRRAIVWFARAPFLTLSAASFVPIPVDVVRILAVSTAYPRTRYVLASFLGRFPRYLLLAYLGYELKLSNRAILAVLLVTVLLGAAKGGAKLWQRTAARRREKHADE